MFEPIHRVMYHCDAAVMLADWQAYVLVDGLLITGQNPASSELAAEKLLGLLK